MLLASAACAAACTTFCTSLILRGAADGVVVGVVVPLEDEDEVTLPQPTKSTVSATAMPRANSIPNASVLRRFRYAWRDSTGFRRARSMGALSVGNTRFCKPTIIYLRTNGERVTPLGHDVNDVKIGMVAGSAYAFVADGKNGLRVLQTVSSFDDPAHFSGFSPRPKPKLIATARTRGPALAISKGIDRDRGVDESGNQLAVFGRRGARPLNRAESQRLYLRNNQLYTVTDQPVEHPN